MIVKPHLRWNLEFLQPNEYPDFKSWALFFRRGDGVTVVRVLGVTVRVFK